MNSGILNTAAGIFSFFLFVLALILLADESPALMSERPAAVTLLLLSVLFLFFLYFRLALKKKTARSSKKIHAASEPDLLKSNEEQEAEKKAGQKQKEIMARELSEKLFNDITGDSIQTFGQNLLTRFAEELHTVQGLVFIRKTGRNSFSMAANYAYYAVDPPADFAEGEGISGQAAKDKRILNISAIPEGYITVLSGLGSTTPKHLLILPFVHEGVTVAILEASSFTPFPPYIEQACEMYSEKIGAQLASLQANN